MSGTCPGLEGPDTRLNPHSWSHTGQALSPGQCFIAEVAPGLTLYLLPVRHGTCPTLPFAAPSQLCLCPFHLFFPRGLAKSTTEGSPSWSSAPVLSLA